jgi:dolichol-phosphate mannosyltransferase
MLPGLSVVIPCFNEEATLSGVIQKSLEAASALARECEILVVDDGSQDASASIAKRWSDTDPRVQLFLHERNRGFGAAQRTGFCFARYELVTAIPSDGQFEPADLSKLTTAIDGADIVLGYREDRGDGYYRSVKTRVFRWTMRLLFGIRFRDVNWVKLYRRSVFEKIQITSEGIGIEAEILVKALQAGFRAVEVKVGYFPRVAGEAKGDQLMNVLITIVELLRLRLGLI